MSSSRRRGWLNALVRPWSPSGAAPRRRRRARPLQLEHLECRLALSAFLVNVAGDSSGHGTGAPSSDGNPLHGDLRYCLNQAIANQQADTISFASNVSGTISLNTNLTTEPAGFANSDGKTAFIIGPDDNITITGPGITINGGGNTRLFMVQAGATLNLTDLTLTGGSATGGAGGEGGIGGGGGGGAGLGGAVLDSGTFTANGCTFSNNQATGGAGGSTPINNAGEGGGGGIGGPGGNGNASFHLIYEHGSAVVSYNVGGGQGGGAAGSYYGGWGGGFGGGGAGGGFAGGTGGAGGFGGGGGGGGSGGGPDDPHPSGAPRALAALAAAPAGGAATPANNCSITAAAPAAGAAPAWAVPCSATGAPLLSTTTPSSRIPPAAAPEAAPPAII